MSDIKEPAESRCAAPKMIASLSSQDAQGKNGQGPAISKYFSPGSSRHSDWTIVESRGMRRGSKRARNE